MTKEMVDQLRAEAITWLGTPHVNKRAIKGVGVDCVNLVIACYKHIGVLDKQFKLSNYNVLSGIHEVNTGIEDSINATQLMEEVSDLQDGDIVTFKTLGMSRHIALYIDNTLYHSLVYHGVISSDLNLWKSRINKIFRIKGNK